MTCDQTLVSFYLPNLSEGGVQRMVINLAHGLLEQGIKVDLVIDRLEGPFVEQIPSGARLIDMKAPRLRERISWVARYLKQEQPKVMFSNMHYNTEIAILAKRLFKLSTYVVAIEHGTPSQIERCSIRQPLHFLGLTPSRPTSLIRYIYPLADDIVAVSQGVAKDLARITGLPVERIKVIYNPIVSSELTEKAKEPVDHPWFAPGEPPVVLAVGRLVEQKDFYTLIRAFDQVRKRQKARLVILGSGPQQPTLESFITELGLESDVALLGFLPNPYAYMARAGVFVLSSIWEGFGNVLVEAMATGTPVVSTNCESGPAEILNHGQYGWLTPVGDSNALAEAIIKVLSNGAKPVDSTWLDQFTLESVSKKFISLPYLAC